MRILKLLPALLIGGVTSVSAAIPGDLGDDSRSSFTIMLALQPTLEITTATDISINIDDRNADVRYQQPFCVRGSANARYTVTAFGDTGSGGSFVLRGGDNEALPFSLRFSGNPVSASEVEVLSDSIASRTYRILPPGSDCGGQTYFVVQFESEDLVDAGSGLYSGSITFLVSPV